MEKSRSLFQQVIGHKMLFVAFLLFATDILAEVVTPSDVSIHVNTTTDVNISTSPFPASSKMAMEISMPTLPDAITPYTFGNLSTSKQPALTYKETTPVSKQEQQSTTAYLETTKSIEPKEDRTSPIPPGQDVPELTQIPKIGSTSGQPTLPFKEAPPVSKQELQSTTAVYPVVPEDTSSPMPSKVSVSTKEKHPRTEATEIQESKPPPVQKEVPSKMTVTLHFDSEAVSSPTKDLGTRSQGSVFEQSANATAYIETTESTEPKEDRTRPMPPGQAAPELTQTSKTGRYYTSGPFSTLETHINNESISDERPSGKKHSVIIVAVILTILLLVGLLAFLCHRRRHHSGSTSFNSPEWAGQATLPDDTGLDKDMEQQAGPVGEGETRRGTLVTFFGKRQSRIPSIAMEDVSGKGGKEETEQLLCREAEIGSPSEATGDANGKVPEPLKGSSQKSPAPIN